MSLVRSFVPSIRTVLGRPTIWAVALAVALAVAVAVGLALRPSVALAQGGMQPGGAGPGGRGSNNPPIARNTLDPHMLDMVKAMDPDNPIALILAARTDLKLTESQIANLYKIHDSMVHEQAHSRTALDTLGPNPSFKSIDLVHLTAAGRDSLLGHRKAVAAANGEIHDAARAAREQALAVLTPEQQLKLIELELHVRQASETPHDTGTEQYSKPNG
jgi:hypothetical protein